MRNERLQQRMTYLVLALGVFAYGVVQSLVFPVLPTLQRAFHTSQTNVTWALTANLVAAAIATPILGRCGDMTGKKRMFVVAVGALAAGSLIAAFATSLSLLLIGRAVQGIGAGVLPLAFGLARDEFPAEKVPGAVGTIAVMAAVGGGTGLVLGGPIIDVLDYHWLFWIPFIISILAAAAAFVFIPESPVRTQGRINWIAALLLSGWLVSLLLAVSKAPVWGWASPTVTGLLAAAVVLIVVWIRVESRSQMPLIDMTMMRLRPVWTTNLAALLFGVGFYSVLAFVPAFLQAPTSSPYGFGVSVTESGLLVLPLAVTMFLFGMFTGKFVERYGSKSMVILGALVGMGGFLVLAFAHSQKYEFCLATAIIGIGFGLVSSAMANLIVAAVPFEQTGVASGMNANIRTIGGAIGAAVTTSIVTIGASSDGLPKESGYTHGFLLLAGTMVLTALVAILVPAVRRNQSTHRETEVPLRHAELALVSAGTLVGDESE